jgi:GNAT superfamily N-acetyltransferase
MKITGSSLDLILEVTLSSTRLVHPELLNDGGCSRWFAELSGYDTSPDDSIALGSASIVLFRDARWDSGFYDRMDEVDADMELIAAAVCDDSGAAADDLGGDLIVIDRVSIDPDHRGRRLSHQLVDVAAEALSPEGVIAMLPMPPGDQRPTNVAKLQQHWSSAGFIGRKHGVFVRSVARP